MYQIFLYHISFWPKIISTKKIVTKIFWPNFFKNKFSFRLNFFTKEIFFWYRFLSDQNIFWTKYFFEPIFFQTNFCLTNFWNQFLPSSAKAPAPAGLSWFYFQLLQPTHHPPTRKSLFLSKAVYKYKPKHRWVTNHHHKV